MIRVRALSKEFGMRDNGAGVEWLDVAGDMVCEQLGCAERCAAEETGA